jgi:glycogen synthase
MAETVVCAQGGLLHSDFITTVSPTYAKEVLTPEVRNNWNWILIKFDLLASAVH